MRIALWPALALLVCLVACSAEPVEDVTQRPVKDRVTDEELDRAIELCAEYLVRQVQPDGKFVYRIHLDGDPTAPRYNMLRHAGSMYSLFMHHQANPTEDVAVAISHASGFLLRMVGPVPEWPGAMAVWSLNEVSGTGDPPQAKLGGAGLGLVALVGAEQIHPGSIPLETMRGLARFILHMQKDDGSYYSKYWREGGRDDTWTSLYYPGEAALGLVMLYERDPDPRWLQGAADALGYLTRLRENQTGYVEADHWALLATARLLPYYDRVRPPVPESALHRHAVQVVVSCLAQEVSGGSGNPLTGALVVDGRTTPTATRMEGTLAALTFLPDSQEPVRRRIRRAADRAIEFLCRSQVRNGEHAGAIPRAIQQLPITAQNAGTFNRRQREVRIDYVQHTLSALIQYRELRAGTGTTEAD